MLPRILACILLLFTTPAFSADTQFKFGGAEHIFIGDDIELFFSSEELGKKGHVFQLPSGLKASYGDMLAFGDFYEILNKAISLGKSEEERDARFLKAFNSFAYTSENAKEAALILEVLHKEQELVKDALKKGEDPYQVLTEHSNELGRQLNCITGGGCMPKVWWSQPGRFLKLANVDYDHFGAHAWLAYKTGHHLAMREAIAAGKTKDIHKLEIAYAMNAFACHFLSDRFSAGHMRTPRFELSNEVTPQLTGSLLSTFMHNEENAYGLHVHNLRGDRWIAYGDRYYFSSQNRTSRKLQKELLQRSADQIFTAYVRGYEPEDNLQELVPLPDENAESSNADVSPLFYRSEKSKKLMRRQDVGNVYDKHWTEDWWGWSTLALLAKTHGVPPEAQMKLAHSEYVDKALEYGLITDPIILEQIKLKR